MRIRRAFLYKYTLFACTSGLPYIFFSAWRVNFLFCIFMFFWRLHHLFHIFCVFWLYVPTVVQAIQKLVGILKVRMILFLFIFVFDELSIDLFVKDLQFFATEFLLHSCETVYLELENQHAFFVLAAGELKFLSLVAVQNQRRSLTSFDEILS